MAAYSTTPQAHETIAALWRLEKIILNELDFKNVVQKIVESVLSELGYLELGYQVIVLTLIDPQTQTLKRISYSRTEKAEKAIGALSVPFANINIPLSATDNLCIKALQMKQPLITHNVTDVFYPVLTPEEIMPIQEAVGIKTTLVYPVYSQEQPVGALIFSLVKEEHEVSQDEKDLLAGFTDVVGLAVQNARLYTSVQETSARLKAANEKLQELDKLKDEFVSLASHELRTPLTAIKSYLWMVLAQDQDLGPLTEKQKSYLDRTYKASEQLLALVNDMLDVSRIESGRMTITKEPCDMVHLAKDVISQMMAAAQAKHIQLFCNEQQMPQMSADNGRIREVLTNLIGNSLKFTPENGSITVSFATKDNMLLTSVTDTGKGIKPEDISKLFQKFGMIAGNYLTRDTSQGTGLGLYLCKKIVELHGGTIAASSEGENKGATFTFSLPLLATS